MVMILSRTCTGKHLLLKDIGVQNGCLTTLFQHMSTTNGFAYFIINEEQKKQNIK